MPSENYTGELAPKSQNLKIFATLLLLAFTCLISSYLQLFLTATVGKEEVGKSEGEESNLVQNIILVSRFGFVFSAWFIESYLGKYYSLISGTISGCVCNVLLLFIFFTPWISGKYFFYYSSLIFYVISHFCLSYTLTTFILDQLLMSQREKIRILAGFLVWEDAIAEGLTRIIMELLPTKKIFVIFILFASYFTIFTFLWLLKDKLRIKFHFGIMEKIVGCLINAWYHNENRKKPTGPIPDIQNIRLSINYVKYVEKYSDDVKNAAQQFVVIFINFIPTIAFSTFLYIQRSVWNTQVKLMSNEDKLYSDVGSIMILLSCITVAVNEIIIFFGIRKTFNISVSKITLFVISMIILTLSVTCTTYVQYRIDIGFPELTDHKFAQIRIYNGFTSEVALRSKSYNQIIQPFEKLEIVYQTDKPNKYKKIRLRFGNEKRVYKKLLYAKKGHIVSYIICNHRCSKISGYDAIKPKQQTSNATLFVISCLDHSNSSLKISTSSQVINTNTPIEGKKNTHEIVGDKKGAKIEITIGNKTQNLIIESKGETYLMLIPMLSHYGNDLARIFTIKDQAEVSFKLLFLPMIISSFGESMYISAALKFVGVEAPEIIRTVCYAMFYLQAVFGRLIGRAVGKSFGGTYQYYELIIVILFFVASASLSACIFLKYAPSSPEEE